MRQDSGEVGAELLDSGGEDLTYGCSVDGGRLCSRRLASLGKQKKYSHHSTVAVVDLLH